MSVLAHESHRSGPFTSSSSGKHQQQSGKSGSGSNSAGAGAGAGLGSVVAAERRNGNLDTILSNAGLAGIWKATSFDIVLDQQRRYGLLIDKLIEVRAFSVCPVCTCLHSFSCTLSLMLQPSRSLFKFISQFYSSSPHFTNSATPFLEQ